MFKFNKNYNDLKQVEVFYPDFKKLHDSLEQEGKYPYNSCFEGKIKGMEGEDEKTATYLLQSSETQKKRDKKIEELLRDGFSEIKNGEGTIKYKEVIMVGTNYSKDSTKDFEGARIMFKDNLPNFIIPKGYSRRGIMLYPDRLIFAK